MFGGDDEEGEIKMPEQKVKPKKPTKTKKLFDDDENWWLWEIKDI